MEQKCGNWELDLITNKLNWSDDQYKLYGYEPKELDLNNEFFIIKTTHLSDVDRISKIIQDAVAKYNSYSFNRKIIKKDGTVALAKTNADIYRTNGIATKIVGTTQEIVPDSPDEKDHNCPHVFKTLMQDYKKTIYFEIFKIVKEKNIAQDICQEVFIKAWQKMYQYDSKKGEFYTWLVSIARNHCKDYFRSKNFKIFKNSLPLDAVQTASRYHSPFNMDNYDVNKMLQQLPKSQKEVIDLLFLKGFTQTEVASMKNIPLGTIKSQSRYALQKLRDLACLQQF